MDAAFRTLYKDKPVKVFFCGLHNAGKTTLLYRLKLGEVTTTHPYMAEFYGEKLDVDGISIIAWDVVVRQKTHPLYHMYMTGVDSVVFMMDSSSRDRLTEAVDEYFTLINPTVQERQLPVLVLANKQDNDEVMSPEEIKNAIYEKGGEAFRVNTVIEVFPTVALTLEGVTPALEWLTSQLALKMARKSYSPFKAVLPKAKQFPVSVLKSAYHRVVGLLRGCGPQRQEKPE